MIKVIIGTNFERNSVIVPRNTTVKQILEDNNINAAGKLVYIGSTAVTDHSKTLADIGVTDECLLTCATKADGGNFYNKSIRVVSSTIKTIRY